MSGATYYSILGLKPDASREAIQSAFATLVGKYPAGSELVRNSDYQQLLQAYEVLVDPHRRATYDSLMADMAPPSLVMTVQASRSTVPVSNSPQALYLLVEINPPQQTMKSRRPLNLCLVLDRSTSMVGKRLDFLRTAVDLVINRLAPDDIISIITFSDRAEVVHSASHVSNKNAMSAEIRRIQASGGTEIYQGLIAGIEQLRQTPLAKYNNHLILLTDGHTYGDAEECLQLAARAATQQIGFTAFGLGDEWNDQFLDRLVAPSGGLSAFIEDPDQIIQHLQKRISGLGIVHARNLRLKKNFPPDLTLQFSFKLLPFSQPLDFSEREIKLGNIEGKGVLSFLLELTLQPQQRETRITIPLEITADIPARNGQDQVFKNQFQLLVTSKAPNMEPPKDLIKAVRVLNMYRMNEKVWEEIEAGNVDLAATRMRHLTTRLLEAGEIKLAQQAHAETERLSSVGTLSAEGRKRLKYGTRALLAQSAIIEEPHDSM